MMGVVDAAQIYQSAEVRNIQNQQLQRWGRKEMVNAEKQLQRHISQLERQAAAFVKERLGL
ncbi:hypothetical protein D3C77_782910 [compost metagenome]